MNLLEDILYSPIRDNIEIENTTSVKNTTPTFISEGIFRMDKWIPTKAAMLATLSAKKSIQLDNILENLKRYHLAKINARTENSDYIIKYACTIIPIIRRVFPKLLAHELVGIQVVPNVASLCNHT